MAAALGWDASTTPANVADIGTKFLDGAMLRRLIGLIAVRLATLEGAAATRAIENLADDGEEIQVTMGFSLGLSMATGAVKLTTIMIAVALFVALLVKLVATRPSTRESSSTRPSTRESSSQTDPQERIVITTKFGSKFHVRHDCDGLRTAKGTTEWTACLKCG